MGHRESGELGHTARFISGQGTRQGMTSVTDPMAVLHERAPEFSDEEAVDILRTHWGINAGVRSLVSERDQNFRATAGDGAEYVLKIANSAEPEVVTDFQIKALVHIGARVDALDLPIRAPEVYLARDGADSIRVERNGDSHVIRLVSFVPGIPLGDNLPSPELARNMGEYLANLGIALDGFSHPGSAHSLMWDIQQAPKLRDLVGYVRSPEVGATVSAALDDFESHVSPVMPELRRQVIHPVLEQTTHRPRRSCWNSDRWTWLRIAAAKPAQRTGMESIAFGS